MPEASLSRLSVVEERYGEKRKDDRRQRAVAHAHSFPVERQQNYGKKFCSAQPAQMLRQQPCASGVPARRLKSPAAVCRQYRYDRCPRLRSPAGDAKRGTRKSRVWALPTISQYIQQDDTIPAYRQTTKNATFNAKNRLVNRRYSAEEQQSAGAKVLATLHGLRAGLIRVQRRHRAIAGHDEIRLMIAQPRTTRAIPDVAMNVVIRTPRLHQEDNLPQGR